MLGKSLFSLWEAIPLVEKLDQTKPKPRRGETKGEKRRRTAGAFLRNMKLVRRTTVRLHKHEHRC